MDGSAQSCEEQTHGWEDHVELKALEGIVQLSLTVVWVKQRPLAVTVTVGL
jgi:hypothetical protein